MNGSVRILADVNALATRSVGRWRVCHYVQHAFVVEHEIARETALLLPAKDATQVVVWEHPAMGVARVLWRTREATIVVLTEPVEEHVSGFAVTDAVEPQLFDQAVLQRLVGALDATFGSSGANNRSRASMPSWHRP